MGRFDELLNDDKVVEGNDPNYTPAFEPEAWFAIMLGVMFADEELSETENEAMLQQVYNKRIFQGIDIAYHYQRAMDALVEFGGEKIIRDAAPHIAPEQRATVFSLVVELTMVDGHVHEGEIAMLDVAAQALEVPQELAEKIIEVFKIRYFDNCRIEEV